jgi:DNA-binding NarL/FixJ family response regulator
MTDKNCLPHRRSRRSGSPLPGARIRILIADRSELYRELLKMAVEVRPRLEVMGTVGNGYQAVKTVAAQHPDLVLMDLDLPGLNGLQSMALLREHHPTTRVIIVAAEDSEDVRATCLAQGAQGFISKRHLYPELHRRIMEVCADPAPAGSHEVN